MRARPAMLLLVFCWAVSCGKGPSAEFDQRPPIPTAPVAIPVQPAEAEPQGSTQDVRVGEDLRNPGSPDNSIANPALSGPGPAARTYTYVPAISPRTLPGEKVSETRPAPPTAPRTDPMKTTPPPQGTPLTVQPPPSTGPAPRPLNP